MLLLATQQFKFSSQENPKYLGSFTGRGGPPNNLVYGAPKCVGCRTQKYTAKSHKIYKTTSKILRHILTANFIIKDTPKL